MERVDRGADEAYGGGEGKESDRTCGSGRRGNGDCLRIRSRGSLEPVSPLTVCLE